MSALWRGNAGGTAEGWPFVPMGTEGVLFLRNKGMVGYMGKYQPLEEYLKRSGKESITLSCTEIESIIGDTLPKSEKDWQAWWANDRTHSQAAAWLSAGYKTSGVKCGKPVTFIKI